MSIPLSDLLLKVVPIVSILLFIPAFIPWMVFYQYQNSLGLCEYDYTNHHRILPPLVLAKALYQLDFERMVMSREKGQLKFNHLIRATMLDLLIEEIFV